MKYSLIYWIIPSLLSLTNGYVAAQDSVRTEREEFVFKVKHEQAVTSRYNSIDYLDSRRDTSSIGVVELTDRKIVRLMLPVDVQFHLSGLLAAYSKPNPGEGKLLFQLRRFSFAEPLGSRYCYLAATLYVNKDGRYAELANLDTTFVELRSVRKLVEADTRDALFNFFTGHIGTPAAGGITYSLDDLHHRDSLDKLQLPVYRRSGYVEGLYGTYAAFRDQQPDLHGEVKVGDSGKIVKVRVTDRDWKYAQREHIYALVYKGVPYAVTYLGFWPLEKVGDDFYFTGKLKLVPSAGEQAGAQFMFGLGGLAARRALGDKYICRSMLDHQNGEFIHLKLLAVAY